MPWRRPDRRRHLVAGALAAFVGVAPTAEAESGKRPLASTLTASITLHRTDGTGIERPPTGVPVRIDVALSDAVTGEAPRGLLLEGWIRPVAPTDLACGQAARAFRATRRIPTDGIDLNGVLVASFNVDGSYGLADPRLDLATANMVGAGNFGTPPADVAIDRDLQRILVLSHDGRSVEAIAANGDRTLLVSPATTAKSLLAGRDGDFWLGGLGVGGRDLVLIGEGGVGRVRHPLPGPLGRLVAVSEDVVLAVASDGFVLFDRRTGAHLGTATSQEGVADAGAAVLDDGRGGRTLVTASIGADPLVGYIAFGDALDRPRRVPLAAPAERVAVHPKSGTALFYSRAGAISVVDPASGGLVGAVSLASGIGAAEFAGDAGFFLAPDQSGVIVLDLGSVTPGQQPVLREVDLGPRTGATRTDPLHLLIPLPPSPQVLAVHADTYTGFIVTEQDSMGDAPPMTAMRLRGGKPERVVVLDRSFRETADGHFSTVATLKRGGSHELVLTTGIGGMSTCFRFEVEGDAATARPAPTLTIAKRAIKVGQVSRIVLRLWSPDGEPVVPARPFIAIASLEFGWKADLEAEVDATGAVEARFSPPVPGLYAVRLVDRARPADFPRTAVLEVSP